MKLTALVVGEDVDLALAPFQELEGDPEDRRVEDVEDTDFRREEWQDDGVDMPFAEWLRLEAELPGLEPGDAPDRAGLHRDGWFEVGPDGEVLRVIQRENPDAKWDWYRVWPWQDGGWAPRLSGGRAASMSLGDLDVQGARSDAETVAVRTFEVWSAIVEAHGAPPPWADARTRMSRLAWDRLPAIRAFRDAVDTWDHWTDPVETIGFDLNAYVTRERQRALVTTALIADGTWHELAEGAGLLPSPQALDAWAAEFWRRLGDQGPEVWITALSVHR